MAGLHYNFFPTDFFYPRPPQPSSPLPPPPTPLIKKTEAADPDDDTKQPGSMVQRLNNKSNVSMSGKQG
ncbi:hypothetical protein V6N13_088992 [Hibiscus sabdariffa]|uniref:Uncharacterized protein n=1 Tax=Hibiscus sabdariffa TaxID=183260 RepID=A0ABR2G124_9ROSI